MFEGKPAILPRAQWLDALCELALHCADGDAFEAHDRVRDMNELLLIAPETRLLDGMRPVSPCRLETLLDVGAPDSVVLAMLDSGAGYMLSRSGDGQSLATVILPSSLIERSAAGASPALALIGALALSLSTANDGERALSQRSTELVRAALH